MALAGLVFIPPFKAELKAETKGEYLVKAAFLYHFAKFVTWPKEAFSDEKSPFRLCILGDDVFGGALDSIAGKKIKGRLLTVHRIDAITDMPKCHMLFISPSERKDLSRIFSAMGTHNILTIGDMTDFAEKGGMINLVKVDKRVKFEINLRAARKSGLKISSKLLKLATLIRSGP